MRLEDDQDTSTRGRLSSTIRVFWSRERCWNSDIVKIYVRTSLAADGEKVELKIFPADDQSKAVTIPNLAVADNKVDYFYKMDWKGKGLPAKTTEFIVTARLKDLNITSPWSDPLTVDLLPPLFSA
jgi:hypothetical protein